jgi:hypothetical protein
MDSDGQAQNWSAGLNLIGMALLLMAKVFRPDLDLIELDSQAAQLATALSVVFGYVLHLLSSKFVHQFALKGLPLIENHIQKRQTKNNRDGREMTTSSPDIAPFPAWVQAVFVLLFILFTGGVFAFALSDGMGEDAANGLAGLHREIERAMQTFLSEQRCEDRENTNG